MSASRAADVLSSIEMFVEEPRFLNRSTSLQIAAHYSTVDLLCEVYAVPYPKMTWYKVVDNGEEKTKTQQLQLALVNTQR